MNPIKRDMFLEPSFQPPKAKAIPNFEKMHAEFQDKLDKQRKGKRPTESKPFQFQESRKLPPRDYLDQENEMMKTTKMKPAVDKLEEAMKWRNHKPKYQPPSIKKWEQNIERIKKEKEDKQKKIEEEEAAKLEKQKKREILAVEVREKFAKSENASKLKSNQEEAVKRKKKEFKEAEEAYLKKKSEILESVKQRPLLMETKCRGRAYLEKLKTLDKIDTRLREKGMKSKDRMRMYTKDEIKMLSEIKALKARGFKSFRNELQVGDDVSLSPPKSGSDYDYEELEKEYGDDAATSVKASKKGSIKGRSSIKGGADEKGKSFLHSSANVGDSSSTKKKGLTDEDYNKLNNLIDGSADEITTKLPEKRNSGLSSIKGKDDKLLRKVNSIAQSEDDYKPATQKKEATPQKNVAAPAAESKKKEESPVEKKKQALEKMKFDSLESDKEKSVEEQYDEDFD